METPLSWTGLLLLQMKRNERDICLMRGWRYNLKGWRTTERIVAALICAAIALSCASAAIQAASGGSDGDTLVVGVPVDRCPVFYRDADTGMITGFREKVDGDGGYVSGGFFVFEPGIFDYLEDDGTFLEKEPLEKLAKDGEFAAYIHSGFWQSMDTLRDKMKLEELWQSGNPPWKVW